MLITRQLKAGERPPLEGKPLAVLPLEPSNLPDITFEAGSDGLDEYQAADVEISGGWILTLIRYKRSPTSGIDVHVAADTGQFSQALGALAEATGLNYEDFAWVSPLARG